MEKSRKVEMLEKLRSQAEMTLKAMDGVSPNMLSGVTDRMFHELRVYQIELETQNEELRQAQSELEETKNKYFELYEMAPVGYFTLEPSGIIAEVNLTGADMLDFERQYLLHRGFSMFVDPLFQDTFFMHRKQCIESGKKQICEVKLVKKDKTTFYAHLQTTAWQDSEETLGKLWMTVADISERKELEEQLLQCHKMEALGRMAGGLAHDFNNILFAILGNTEMAMSDIPKESAAYRCLESSLFSISRAKTLVQQILDFSHKASFAEKPINLNGIIEKSLLLLRSGLPTSILIHYECHAENDCILSDKEQIGQILLNLFNNAIYAMGCYEGVIRITLDNVMFPKIEIIGNQTLKPGNYIRLSVSDTGSGIRSDIIYRIFDPYFTTKPVGQGSGLGLSVVYGIVRKHNGAIKAENLEDRGAVFHVFLPIFESETH